MLDKLVTKIISRMTFKSNKKKSEKKPSLIKEVMDSPECFKLEAFIEGDEFIVKIKRKENPKQEREDEES